MTNFGELCVPPDAELIQRINKNDRKAFDAVVREYQSMVFTVCVRIVGNRQDAEDAAQNTFVSFFRKSGSFRGDASISTWLYRIAVNASISQIRKRRWSQMFDFLSIGEQHDGRSVDPAGDPAERPDIAAEIKQQRRDLAHALGKLQEKQRIAFILHKYQGLPHKEITEIMQLSHSAVESLIFRAKKALQKHLSDTAEQFSEKTQDFGGGRRLRYVSQEQKS